MSQIKIAKSLEGIDAELFLAACDMIERFPRSYDPRVPETDGQEMGREPACGSIFCFGGWMYALKGREVAPFFDPVSLLVKRGIPPSIVELNRCFIINHVINKANIFSTNHDSFPDPFYSIAERTRRGSKEYAKNAANRFRYFLGTGR